MHVQDIINRVTHLANRLSARRMQPSIVVVGTETALRLKMYGHEYVHIRIEHRRAYIMGIRCVSSRDVPEDFVGVYGDVP